MVQLSQLCMTTGKTIALTRWTFVDKDDNKKQRQELHYNKRINTIIRFNNFKYVVLNIREPKYIKEIINIKVDTGDNMIILGTLTTHLH